MKMDSTSMFHPAEGSGTVKEQCAAIVKKLKLDHKESKKRTKSHKRGVSHDRRASNKVQCKFCDKTMSLNYLKGHVRNSCPNKPNDIDDDLPREHFIRVSSNESLSNSSDSDEVESLNDDDLYENESASQKRFKPNH